jgi:hypothetical protein
LRLAAERSLWARERLARVETLREGLPDARLVEIPLFAGATTGMELTVRVAEVLESLAREDRDGTR